MSRLGALHPFWSGKSSFNRTPRHACPFDKNTARPTEFPCCSPTAWNALPSLLRSSCISRGQFRAGLQTYLFTRTYTDSSENFCGRLYCFTLHLLLVCRPKYAPLWTLHRRMASQCRPRSYSVVKDKCGRLVGVLRRSKRWRLAVSQR